jgi:hypothetical protein
VRNANVRRHIDDPSAVATSSEAASATDDADADVSDSAAHSDGSASPKVDGTRTTHVPATTTLAPARRSAQASLLGRRAAMKAASKHWVSKPSGRTKAARLATWQA